MPREPVVRVVDVVRVLRPSRRTRLVTKLSVVTGAKRAAGGRRRDDVELPADSIVAPVSLKARDRRSRARIRRSRSPPQPASDADKHDASSEEQRLTAVSLGADRAPAIGTVAACRPDNSVSRGLRAARRSSRLSTCSRVRSSAVNALTSSTHRSCAPSPARRTRRRDASSMSSTPTSTCGGHTSSSRPTTSLGFSPPWLVDAAAPTWARSAVR